MYKRVKEQDPSAGGVGVFHTPPPHELNVRRRSGRREHHAQIDPDGVTGLSAPAVAVVVGRDVEHADGVHGCSSDDDGLVVAGEPLDGGDEGEDERESAGHQGHGGADDEHVVVDLGDGGARFVRDSAEQEGHVEEEAGKEDDAGHLERTGLGDCDQDAE